MQETLQSTFNAIVLQQKTLVCGMYDRQQQFLLRWIKSSRTSAL